MMPIFLLVEAFLFFNWQRFRTFSVPDLLT
jgi:hypothetical protein